jgi:hypothetical protein
MKILFWFNGSGGQRRERKVVDFPQITDLDRLNSGFYWPEIENELEDWKESLMSNSEYQRWGWTENFDEIKKEPIKE